MFLPDLIIYAIGMVTVGFFAVIIVLAIQEYIQEKINKRG